MINTVHDKKQVGCIYEIVLVSVNMLMLRDTSMIYHCKFMIMKTNVIINEMKNGCSNFLSMNILFTKDVLTIELLIPPCKSY